MSFFEKNSIWWKTPNAKSEDSTFCYMDKDLILSENKYGESFIQLNKYIITLDSQCNIKLKEDNWEQKPYIEAIIPEHFPS